MIIRKALARDVPELVSFAAMPRAQDSVKVYSENLLTLYK